MKKYISIFELFARNTIYKLWLILIAMGIVQIVMFWRAMAEWAPIGVAEYGILEAVEYYGLEWMVDRSNSAGFMGVAFVLMTAVLCWSGCNIGSKSNYTIQRLQVSEKAVFIMQSLYNSFCYVLLLGVQLAVLLVQCRMFIEQSDNVTNQTVFLAFYRNEFMHSVLPMESGFRWFMNGVLIICCGVAAALFTFLQRRGKTAWTLLVTVAAILLGFVQELGNQLILVTAIVVFIIVGLATYFHVFQKNEDE
ncbi:MAG: hypothetical protein IJZ23_05205 [Roseburia sp.]|nr:hypothetical protein [Roseburia sp.]